MPTLTARELLDQYPKKFQKEYSKWAEHELDYTWWDYLEEQLKEKLAPAGVRVDKVWFSLSYSQGDYASFEGQINVAEWMLAKGYDETYPALYMAAVDYCEYASVSDRTRGSWPRVNLDSNMVGNTDPAGIFKHLDCEAWDELVYEQFDASGLEQEMQDYVVDICQQLYSDLQDEYEHLTSEEAFIESCEFNEITFETEECEA